MDLSISRVLFGGATLAMLLVCASGCSGGQSGAGRSQSPSAGVTGAPVTVPRWVKGQFAPSEEFYGRCANPRTGTHPWTGEAYDDRSGTLTHEKMWLRSIMQELYLWYGDMNDVDPADVSLGDYLVELRAPQDRFSFSRPLDLAVAQDQGLQVDYGIRWSYQSRPSEMVVRVADVSRTSPYFGQIERGDWVRSVDGIDLDSAQLADVNAIEAALFPAHPGEVHSVTLIDHQSGKPAQIELIAQELEFATVPRVSVIDTEQGSVGYLQFDQHLAKSEGELIAAVEQLRDQGISDLVLDLRYNLGGYLDIASQLSYMVAGPGYASGQIFYQTRFNDRLGTTDPFTGEDVEPIAFHETTRFGEGEAQDLPSLDLSRVFVLTGPHTCSASEAIINGLEGVGVEVFQFGGNTCGKPYGSVEIDNCGTLYSFLMFSASNAQGYGDYFQGFWPSGSDRQLDTHILPGCPAVDDLEHELGNTDEALLAAALHFRRENACPETVAFAQNVTPLTRLPRQGTRASLRLDK